MLLAISSCHVDSCSAISLKGLQDLSHARVVKVGKETVSCSFVGHVLESCGWQVTQKDISACGRFAVNFFGNISNCQVNGICGLVAKQG